MRDKDEVRKVGEESGQASFIGQHKEFEFYFNTMRDVEDFTWRVRLSDTGFKNPL